MPCHTVEERHDAFAYQRLTACDPQLFNAETDEGRTHAVEFFQRQELFLGQKGHVFRHAVHATEVAPVCHRDPKVCDGAGKGVNQRCGHGLIGKGTPNRSQEVIVRLKGAAGAGMVDP